MTIKLRDENLKRSLKQDGLKSLYLIAGNDAYLINRCCELIRNTVDGEVVRLDFATAEEEEVRDHLSSYSFTDKVLILEDFRASDYTDARKKLYGEYLAELPETLRVIVKSYQDSPYFKLTKAAEGFASLCPDSAIVTCERKQGTDLVKYVCAMAKSLGAEMKYDNAAELIRLRGEDLYLLSNEVRKLASACSYGEIDGDVIRRMCPKTTEDSVFDFIRAAEKGNTKQAISLFYDIMEQEQVPNAVIAAISSSYVNMARVSAAREARVSRDKMEEDFGYKKGDRALGVAFDKGGKFSYEKLERIIGLLYDINGQLTASGVDKDILIERGMVQLCGIMSGGLA